MTWRSADKMLPLLPPDFAFVVQFGRETDLSAGRFVGQIEHLASARQGRFANRTEMLAFIDSVLAGVPERIAESPATRKALK